MKTDRVLTIFLIAAFLLSALGFPTPIAQAADWEAKVDPWVLAAAQSGEAEFLVFLRVQANLEAAAPPEGKHARGAFVYQTLTSLAESSQKSLRTALDSQNIPYRPFWLVNALWVRGDLAALRQIARRADVAHIYANPTVKLDLPAIAPNPTAPEAVEWNVLKINADDVWAAGFTGQGTVIGGADTGYDWDHPALIGQYRGWDGTTANHNYNWHDATGGSPNTPADPQGHGTHTMGTMVGDDGGTNQIGVAPGAQWIGCRNMDASGYGTPARYIECYEWFVAPYPIGGDPFSDGDPTKAPDVINNSWGCPPSEGCTDPNILLSAVQNVRAAGIVTVHAAGNSGSSCGTVNTPATIYAESFSVGAVNSSDAIASFSSRGPVTVDGSNRLKPNISAPGVSVRSSTPGTSYGSSSGTSMASPHIAGVVALLISASPALAGQVEALETLIEQSAVPLYTTQGCGGDTPASLPNHTYGWGRVDAWAAVQAIPQNLQLQKTAPAATTPGSLLTYTLAITNSHGLLTAHNVILTDTLPLGVDFVAATGSYSRTGEVIRWELGDLGGMASETVELIVRVPITTPVGVVVNENYAARSDEVSPVFGAPVETLIHRLAVAKIGPAAIVPNHLMTYTLTASNLQPLSATHNAVLTDTLPDEVIFIAAGGNYSVVGKQVTWHLGDLAASEVVTVSLTVRVLQGITGTITNAAYGLVSDEAPTPAKGAPVNTLVQSVGALWWLDSNCFDQWLMPGEALVCQHFLYNSGNYTDTFVLTASSQNGGVIISPAQITLGSDENAPVTVTITAPLYSPGVVEIHTWVTATSTSDPDVSESFVVTGWAYARLFFPLTLGNN